MIIQDVAIILFEDYFMKLKTLACVCVAALLSACTTRIGDFTAVTTKNINLDSKSFVVKREARVTGEDMRFLGIPDMKSAVDNAIQKDKCAVGLSDAVISLKSFPFYSGYVTEGNLIIDRSLPGCR